MKIKWDLKISFGADLNISCTISHQKRRTCFFLHYGGVQWGRNWKETLHFTSNDALKRKSRNSFPTSRLPLSLSLSLSFSLSLFQRHIFDKRLAWSCAEGSRTRETAIHVNREKNSLPYVSKWRKWFSGSTSSTGSNVCSVIFVSVGILISAGTCDLAHNIWGESIIGDNAMVRIGWANGEGHLARLGEETCFSSRIALVPCGVSHLLFFLFLHDNRTTFPLQSNNSSRS